MTSTLLPFLYHTRTILRAHSRITLAFSRSLHTTRRQLKDGDEIPFASYIPKDIVPPEQTHRRGTITPSERRVFERIFADIKARGLKPFVPEDSPASATRTTMSIMQQALLDAKRTRPATFTTPDHLNGPTKDREKALLRFPPELRAAASKAFDTIKPSSSRHSAGDDIAYDTDSIATNQEDPNGDEGWIVPTNTADLTAELEAKRSPERSRVERLITAAVTDFELWDVLEKEVFTMPAKLGIDSNAYKLSITGRRRRKSTNSALTNEAVSHLEDLASSHLEDASEAVQEETDAIAAESDTPPQDLSLHVHGPLYPEYLLLALRRLDTAFHTPSPLAFSVLPRIKELGLESYILGVSTPFYNELLDIYWTRRGDLSGVLDLLEEMQHCGLRFDTQTASFLGKVDTALTMLATRESAGSFGRALATMPEYDRSVRQRIRHWREAADSSAEMGA
ncbi:hypothetical protein F5Y11DRAFT_292288 [Daldinia sp. FL1419]|nr:hypothetical protein F5Y11DRAFT_292288 [Daldinia sp. FL1419]